MRNSRAVGRDELFDQLVKVRDNIEPSLRRDIMNPTETTTLTDFLGYLDLKFLDWQDQVVSRQQRFNTRMPPQTLNRTQPQPRGRIPMQRTQHWTSHRFEANRDQRPNVQDTNQGQNQTPPKPWNRHQTQRRWQGQS
ncbi:hypothetical protein N7516_002558 [Penicillium verrucosum]|uniref:uncharacterized protein n=1 Tax=Penicillium verrucosum TaxID=60171 RepID=UPI0025459BB0|nr:uncharacterized protein N7516_002558 [Penicillium verrucosum]KAJ5942390.1 hypothetical protein N7516_002558 [Penicillium verrucosum]